MAIFTHTTYPVTALVSMIETGQLGLPDLQRPFVWDRAKVRDLLDSLYRGYPAGHFLFWSTNAGHGTHQIGHGDRPAPQKVIVDGQQRLTSLYAVVRGKPVINEDFKSADIRIAFRPSTGEFEVANASTDKDPEWLSNVSDVWNNDKGGFFFIKEFIDRLAATRELEDGEDSRIAEALSRLEAIQGYAFSALELSAELEVEEVAEVFVRTNSKGVALNVADFILNLMCVHWDEGRFQLEAFARAAKQPSTDGPSPFNHFIDPSPDQLLRVAVGVAFRRGQLRAVYQILRGKNADTGDLSPEARDAQFKRLQDAQEKVLDLTNWHEFLKCLVRAGYRSGSMITSDNTILYSYMFFLIGRVDFGVPLTELREIIARWFFMSSLTGRYTGNVESTAESDLARLQDVSTADEFVELLEQLIETNLTNDFWQVNLPEALATSSSYSPALFSYYAALNLLDAPVLFSKMKVKDLLDPGIKAKKASIERHHLFPRGYLKSIGLSRISQTNQIANYAFVEWPTNIAISDQKPSEYFPELWAKLPASEHEGVRLVHALPVGWEQMDYGDFLKERRSMMAAVIRAGYQKLATGEGPFDDEDVDVGSPIAPSVEELLETMETEHVEFKGSARYSYKPDIPEKVIHDGIIKTVAAFANGEGGTLGIGISDEGEILGIQPDLDLKGHDLDAYENWLCTLLETSLGGSVAALNAKIRFEEVGGEVVCLIDVRPSGSPVFAKTSKAEHVFFVRNGNSTRVLEGQELLTYVKERFGG